MKNWILLRKSADYKSISEELNIDPVAVRIMVNRGITDIDEMREFLSEDITRCFEYKGLPYIDEAVKLIKEAASENLKCRIVGDYDADGVCATVILMKGLKLYGLDCDFTIPDRLIDGYGINQNIVTKAIEDKVGFIITCDNGISAGNTIDMAIENGIKVVVTDHHTITESELPAKCNVLVNPKLECNTYPFREICGAQVAYKVLSALFEGDSRFDAIKDELLEFAAIATVTDVMPLLGENRKLVKWLLKRLKNPINPGLRLLAEKCDITSKATDAVCSDIGFRIGPCINAAGRIDVAGIAVNLFLCENEEDRNSTADTLVSLNNDRKELTDKCVEMGSEELIKRFPDGNLPDVIILYLPECHVSICGLVAGRIREKFYHPTLVFTDSGDGITGSGRSIDEYNLIENIQKCADILTKFGGHKAACGLSLDKNNLKELEDRLNSSTGLSKDDLTEKIKIDANMPFGYVSYDLIRDLSKLEPFGTGNPTPVFALRDLLLVKIRPFGNDSSHLFINVRDGSNSLITLKLFRRAAEFEQMIRDEFDDSVCDLIKSDNSSAVINQNIRITVSYYPSVNTYKGNTSIDFTVKDFKLTE